METLIVHPASNDKLKALKAVMKALNINFEVESREQKEDLVLYAAMEEGRKTPWPNPAWMQFLRSRK